MSTTGIEQKFERFMMDIRRENQMHSPEKGKPGKIIGHFTYDFEKQTETFTPTLRYRIISSINRLYSNIYSYFNNKKDNSK